MEFNELLKAIGTEVNRLEMSDSEVNQLIRARYKKQWFIQLDDAEQLDLLTHLRKEHYDF